MRVRLQLQARAMRKRLARVRRQEEARKKRKERARSSPCPYDYCAICKEPMTPVEDRTHLRCGHVFHKVCVYKWLMEYGSHCPICRKGVQ
ncbi:unnamed protein product [Ectocarpus sp. 12 AP-2014]